MKPSSTSLVVSVLTVCALLFLPSDVAGQASSSIRVVHVIVALADNTFQGIVPVPRAIGNGDDPERNLYWGAAYGVKTFLKKSPEWKVVDCERRTGPVLERCVFRHRSQGVLVVADAYRGREIKKATADFFAFSAGRNVETVTTTDRETISAGGGASLIAYIGHDGLMDFRLDNYFSPANTKHREAIVLACASRQFFREGIRYAGAKPLLWTTGLMAPEAYVLGAALAGWVRGEGDEQIRSRAADAYDRYQHCGKKAAHHLFATGL